MCALFVRFIFTPPYTPEVNPMERLWEDLKDALAGHNPLSLNGLSDRLGELTQAYTPSQLSSLTSYPFFKNAANALCSMYTGIRLRRGNRLRFSGAWQKPHHQHHERLVHPFHGFDLALVSVKQIFNRSHGRRAEDAG